MHVDSLCSRFWMVQLHGRKLWRLFPPDQTKHLHPAKSTEGGKGAHYAADVLTADVALYPDLLKVERGVEHVLTPGQLLLVPEGWAHAVQNLDDTAALTCAHATVPSPPCMRACVHACLTTSSRTSLPLSLRAPPCVRARACRSTARACARPCAAYLAPPCDDPAHLTSLTIRYNFVDEANLRCHLALLRPAAGQKLRRLFHTHQAQGVPAEEAAAQAASEPLLAYYAHLHAIAAQQPLRPTVTVAKAHQTWESFFGSQGPYANGGGVAALERTAAALATKLRALLAKPPPPGATPQEDAAALLHALTLDIEEELAERTFQQRKGQNGPDEL